MQQGLGPLAATSCFEWGMTTPVMPSAMHRLRSIIGGSISNLVEWYDYYSLGLIESIEAELKAGKSEVVCHFGALLKVSKDESGVQTRKLLTEHWTDWVDYWAVDFDYESREEVISVPKTFGAEGELPGMADSSGFLEFEEQWTGATSSRTSGRVFARVGIASWSCRARRTRIPGRGGTSWR